MDAAPLHLSTLVAVYPELVDGHSCTFLSLFNYNSSIISSMPRFKTVAWMRQHNAI